MEQNITLYIAHNSKQEIIDKLMDAAKKSKQIEVLGYGKQDERALKEISMCTPDVVVVGQLSPSECKTLIELSPRTRIVMLTIDPNRTSATINELEKAGFYGHAFLNLEEAGPMDVIQNIIDNYEAPSEVETNDALGNFLGEHGNKKQEQTRVEIEKDYTESYDENIEKEQAKTEEELKELEEKEKTSREESEKNKYYKQKIDLLDLKSKFITVYSRKGGTGKTTIAKEIANLYSNVKLPKKLNYTNEYLKVCLVDLDFNQGNVRTQLGIENPVPNIYMWIEDIVTKIKSGIRIEDIKYNKMQVLNRFVKKVDREFFVLCTDQGGIPFRLLDDIESLDTSTNKTLFKKIMDVILVSLRRAFDIVVCDTDSSFDESTLSAFEKSDNVLYIINPTVSDVEGFKVSISEFRAIDTINMDYISIIVNKNTKNSGIYDYIDEMLGSVQYETFSYELNKVVQRNFPVIRTIEIYNEILQAENSFTCATNYGVNNFKKDIINICEYLLPVFKIKGNNQTVVNKNLAKAESKGKLGIPKDKKIVNQKGQIEIVGDLSAVAKLDELVEQLKTIEGISFTKYNKFPIINQKPKTLNKKVWKSYEKELTKEFSFDKNQDKKLSKEQKTQKEVAKTNLKENNTDNNPLSNIKTVEEFELFINENGKDVTRSSLKGYPVIERMPKGLDKKVWKNYQKKLNTILKEEHKEIVKKRKEEKNKRGN